MCVFLCFYVCVWGEGWRVGEKASKQINSVTVPHRSSTCRIETVWEKWCCSMVEVEYRAASGWSNFCRYVLLYPRWSRSWHRQAINRPFFCKAQDYKAASHAYLALRATFGSFLYAQQTVKPPALWISQRFSAGLRTYSVPPSLRASSCGRARGGSSSVRTWWNDTTSPTQNFTETDRRSDKSWSCAGMKVWWEVPWPPDTLPALSTGVMNHINKDSRPDLLERINVKVEPGGGRTGLNQNVPRTGNTMSPSLGSGLCWMKKSPFKKWGGILWGISSKSRCALPSKPAL